MFYTVIYLVVGILILGAQWTGVIGLGKRGKDAAWRTMLAGSILSAISSLATIYYYLAATGIMGRTGGMEWWLVVNGAHSLGSLLFFIGFAIYGMKGSKLTTRIAELEGISNAQADEINALRAGTRG